MFQSIILALAIQGAHDVPKMEVPDSKTVSTIEAAAEKCLLTPLNIDWEKKDERTLKINLANSLLETDEGKKQATFMLAVLKYCIFNWAYDREVTVMFDAGEGEKQE